jgi:hypothetical protein
MSWTERQAYFERLVTMRDRYAESDDDRLPVLSIGDAIRYTEAIMTAIELDAEPWLANNASDGPGRGPAHSPRLPRFASDLWPWPTRSSRSLGRRPEIDSD